MSETVVTVLEYKGVSRVPSHNAGITWLEYVQIMHKLERLEAEKQTWINHAEFYHRWATRDNVTDAERLSVIKHYPLAYEEIEQARQEKPHSPDTAAPVYESSEPSGPTEDAATRKDAEGAAVSLFAWNEAIQRMQAAQKPSDPEIAKVLNSCGNKLYKQSKPTQEPCETCGGRGSVKPVEFNRIICPDCNGTGKRCDSNAVKGV